MAIGARSQAARTYLEKFLDDLGTTELDELVKHGLRALRDTLPNEVVFNNVHLILIINHRYYTKYPTPYFHENVFKW